MSSSPPLDLVVTDPGSVFVHSSWTGAAHLAVGKGRLGRKATGGHVLDGRGLIVLPAFVDSHIHGIGPFRFWGHDTHEEYVYNLAMAARRLPSHGVATFLPSSVAEGDGGAAVLRAVASVVASPREPCAAEIVGAHAEGPFLNPDFAGAHRVEALVSPDPEAVTAFLEEFAGAIEILTAAPSLPGFAELAREACRRGITVQIGHDLPTLAEWRAALDSGASGVTHLFNGMGGLHHRREDLAALALGDPGVVCEIIVDFGFVSAAWIRVALTIAPDRLVAVSDSIGDVAAGASFNGTALTTGEGGILVRESDGAVWSSNSTIEDAAGRLRSLGIGWGDIAKLTSQNLIRHLARRNPAWGGRLARPGAPANLVLVDEAAIVRATVIEGRLAYLRDPGRLQ